MFTRTTVSVGSMFTAMLALTGAGILNCGAAAADPNQDDQFLALLSQNGVGALSGVPSLVATAHLICHKLDAGVSADAIVDALVDNANTVTPGQDPARLLRTETRFLAVSVQAYCPNHQGLATPAGWTSPSHRVVLASVIKETNPADPRPPQPGPDAQNLLPPQAAAPQTPKKMAPPVTGPPPGGGGGGGGNGGGTGGVSPMPPMEPGIITLAP